VSRQFGRLFEWRHILAVAIPSKSTTAPNGSMSWRLCRGSIHRARHDQALMVSDADEIHDLVSPRPMSWRAGPKIERALRRMALK